MGTMPASGAISFNDLRTQLGPSASGTNISISNYYRGGSYVPSTSATREPTTGSNYSLTNPTYFYEILYDQFGNWDVTAYWNGSTAAFTSGSYPSNPPSSITVGSTTYYLADFKFDDGSRVVYSIYRQVATDINTSVPTSGQISMSNFYGARNP